MSLSAMPAATRFRPLADILWPSTGEPVAKALRMALLVLAGTALLALSAKVQVPLPLVPMTMQTLVVLMIGAAYGWKLGSATILAYIAEGMMGIPVFAGASAGPAYMLGGTGGYLVGFLVAAFAVGWLAERGWDRSVVRLFAAMAVGHVILLAFGFAWLAFGLKLGVEKAWLVGVVPFIAGSVVKNTLGALLVPQIMRLADRRA